MPKKAEDLKAAASFKKNGELRGKKLKVLQKAGLNTEEAMKDMLPDDVDAAEYKEIPELVGNGEMQELHNMLQYHLILFDECNLAQLLHGNMHTLQFYVLILYLEEELNKPESKLWDEFSKNLATQQSTSLETQDKLKLILCKCMYGLIHFQLLTVQESAGLYRLWRVVLDYMQNIQPFDPEGPYEEQRLFGPHSPLALHSFLLSYGKDHGLPNLQKYLTSSFIKNVSKMMELFNYDPIEYPNFYREHINVAPPFIPDPNKTEKVIKHVLQ